MSVRSRSALLVGLLLAWAATASSQALSVSSVSGEVGADVAGGGVAYPLSPARSLRIFREWVGVRVTGALVDPRLLRFHAAGRPTQTQHLWSGPVELSEGRGDRLDFDVGVDFLPLAPVSFSGAQRRVSGRTPGTLGSMLDFRRTERSSRLSWRNPYLPLALSFDDRSFRESLRLSSQPVTLQLEGRTRTVRLSAQNRKTVALLERYSYDDRTGGGQDFITTRAGLNHRGRWGTGSSLASAALYAERSGMAPYERRSWEETAHLQHARSIESDYHFGLLRLTTPLGTSRGRVADVVVTARASPRLVAGVGVRAQASQYTGGRQQYYRAGPQAQYSVALPYGARLASGGSVAIERARNVPGPGGLVPVVNERHVVDGSRRFRLDNANVDTTTVVLSSADQTLIFQQGVDFSLTGVQPFVDVVVLPGGRIAVGDTVLVDYGFFVLQPGSASAVATTYSASLLIAGVELYHHRARRNQVGATLESATGTSTQIGSVVSLGDRDEWTTGLRLTRETVVGALEVGGERSRLRTGGQTFTDSRVHGGLAFAARSDVRTTVQADWSATEDGGVDGTLGSVGSSAEWTPLPALRLRGTLVGWWWREHGPQRELRQRFLGGGLEVLWRVRNLDVQARYDRDVWRESFARRQDRVLLRLQRTF